MADAEGDALFAVLRGEAPRARRTLDGERLVRMSCEHALAGVFHEALERLGDRADAALGPVRDRLRTIALAQEGWVRSKLAVARELASALDAARISHVFVKGVAMVLSVYGRPVLRPFGDLDLLVHASSMPQARRVVEALGFVESAEGIDSTMEATYYRARPRELQIDLDLHWLFAGRNGLQAPLQIPTEEILARARRVEGLSIPSLEDSMLLAATNLVRSRLDRMVLIVDFARMTARGPDWSAVRERATAWRLHGALWLGLSLMKEHLRVEPPADLLRAIAPPLWRRRWMRKLLAGTMLWTRDKHAHPYLRYMMPLLSLDSWRDVATAVLASRWRLLGKIGVRP